ncbi:substrate-specific activator of APC-dependent proteolysis [Rhizophlyctis rosea]|uniref:Substrate-specific activator of APC-dependent proteolysis n=1 Tax=Rhizophlyctis rosea TaxID=64517 RepID=A0AAD5X8F3_9FUNG|nr:substrate-specific activator of APC-dependent proteolysis [Rhizophlyctis rosea]
MDNTPSRVPSTNRADTPTTPARFMRPIEVKEPDNPFTPPSTSAGQGGPSSPIAPIATTPTTGKRKRSPSPKFHGSPNTFGADRHTPHFDERYKLYNSFGDDSSANGNDGPSTPSSYSKRLYKAALGVPTTPHRHGSSPYSFEETPGSSARSPVGRYDMPRSASPTRRPWQIPRQPYKVLDAPDLVDDFYLNLVDWSSKNSLAVGLGSCVYLWEANTAKVTKLCELGEDGVSSVSWHDQGKHLAVGTNRGLIQIWDVARTTKMRQYVDHTARVGTLAWKDFELTSGSRDRTIVHHDSRVKERRTDPTAWAIAHTGDPLRPSHTQEVCGLKWNRGSTRWLASGGNDNKLFIWDDRMLDNGRPRPVHEFNEHQAAVKAIAWSPHQNGVLASGGGTADKQIRFWDVTKPKSDPTTILGYHDTGSQVCNLAWSKFSYDLVSSHGYSNNDVRVWKYDHNRRNHPVSNAPIIQQRCDPLTAHGMRVLYMAMSPDGENIVTGAGDETLRFWKVFNRPRLNTQSVLQPMGPQR